MDITYEEFTVEKLKKITLPVLKRIVKEKLVKTEKLTNKIDYINFLMKERDVVYGLSKQKDISEVVEKTINFSNTEVVVGIDEAGQGCYNHELFIGFCILPNYHPDKKWKLINDSKKLSAKKRQELSDYIKEIAIEYVIHRVSVEDIDKYNVFQAKMIGFHQGLDKIKTAFDHVIIDGDKFNDYYRFDKQVKYTCIIKGDGIYKAIAAASILAKHERDSYMIENSKECPEYKWEINKGYCTEEHTRMIIEHGVTKYHRKTFGICKTVTKEYTGYRTIKLM